MVFFQDKLSRNKTVLANFSYLSILQVFTILFPLLTYPYLLRVIGLELYGVIVFAQAIINYVSLVINFGFNMSGARKSGGFIRRIKCFYLELYHLLTYVN